MNSCNSWLLLILSALTVNESFAQNGIRDKTVYTKIAGYEPLSLVTDILNIDLDQEAMEEELVANSNTGLANAHKYYTKGAHSKSVATLKLSPCSVTGIDKGTPLMGEDDYNHDVMGFVYFDVAPQKCYVSFEYSLNETDRFCHVGARPIGDQIVNGCLRRQGTIATGTGEVLAYTYDPFTDNNNGRTLQSFSLMARDLMYECKNNCPYKDFLKYREYYGKANYADQWVTAAFEGGKTEFANGNADFDRLNLAGRSEAIKKGSSYMGIFMYLIGKMESALATCQTKCTNCNAASVQEWDEAVALYTGSLEGVDGSGHGFFPYALADKRCADFHTCGNNRDNDVGTSAVNIEIFNLFRSGQLDILNGVCSPARAHKERIVNLMTVPLIQGTLKYAYITERQESTDKEKAEGAVFAASILPMVDACNKKDAQTIWENMAVGSGNTDFKAVQKAFANNYECLDITCPDVGGLFDEFTREYYEDAHPCGEGEGKMSPFIIAAIVIGAIAGVCLITCFCLPLRRRKYLKKGADMPSPPKEEEKREIEDSDEDGTTKTETFTLQKHFNLV